MAVLPTRTRCVRALLALWPHRSGSVAACDIGSVQLPGCLPLLLAMGKAEKEDSML